MKNNTAKEGNALAVDGKKLAIGSTALNAFLTAIKFFLYFLTGSSALLAEAVHSLTDVIGSLLVVAGIYLAEKKSKRYPWGLYKVENVAAALSAGLIFISAYEIARMIYTPSVEGPRNVDAALMVLCLTAFPVVLFYRYEARRAKELNSPSLIADAENWRTDLAPLLVVAAGLVGSKLSYPVMDKIAAALVLAVVLHAGYRILKDSLKSLLDASVDIKTLDAIRRVLRPFTQISEVVSLSARNSGRFIFVSLVVRLPLTRLKEAYAVAAAAERKIKESMPFIERVNIFYEPEQKDFRRYAVPLEDRESRISEHFAKAPFIALWDVRLADGMIMSQEVIENPFVALEKGKGIKLAEFLVGRKIDIMCTKEDFKGKGPEHVFSDADVSVKKTDMNSLSILMERERQGLYG